MTAGDGLGAGDMKIYQATEGTPPCTELIFREQGKQVINQKKLWLEIIVPQRKTNERGRIAKGIAVLTDQESKKVTFEQKHKEANIPCR